MKTVIGQILGVSIGVAFMGAIGWTIHEYGHVNWWVAGPIVLMVFGQHVEGLMRDSEMKALKHRLGDLEALKAHDGTRYFTVSHNFQSLNSMIGRVSDRIEKLEERGR